MLLDELIEALSNNNSSLTDALLKTKVLLHSIGKRELVDWVNKELNGYPDDDVPPYRIVSSEVIGNVSNIAWRMERQRLPIMHLKESTRERFTVNKVRQSLALVEETVNNNRTLIRNIPVEAHGLFNKGMDNGFGTEAAWCEINTHEIKNITVQVRSRLLDFLLELKGSLGEVSQEQDLKKKALEVDVNEIFKQATFGPNTTIIVGNNNTQHVTNSNTAGDLEALVKAFTSIGIQADEIEDLTKAVAEDERKSIKSFEGSTGSWFTRLIGRAAQGTLGVAVDVVSKTGARAIAAYYGFPI